MKHKRMLFYSNQDNNYKVKSFIWKFGVDTVPGLKHQWVAIDTFKNNMNDVAFLKVNALLKACFLFSISLKVE